MPFLCRFVFRECFLPLRSLSFIYVTASFAEQEFLILMKRNFSIFPSTVLSDLKSYRQAQGQVDSILSSSASFTVLCLILSSMIILR